MKLLNTTATLFAAALAASSASAQDYSAGGGLSTFGPTIEGSYSVMPNLNVRGIGFIPLNYSENGIDAEDYTLDAEINTGALAVLADYYPTGQGWRVSGGLFFSRDELLSGKFTENANTANTFNGGIEFDRKIAPMIAGGYQYDFNSGLYVAGELGAIFTGVKATTTSAANQSDVDQINADLNDLVAYPYIAVSVGLSF